MDTMLIFTDAATSSVTNIAIGVFLCLEKEQLQRYAACSWNELYVQLAGKLVYKQYISKKSTMSEIKTAIAALNFLEQQSLGFSKVEIYTDCQSLCDLLGKRKEKLQKNNFITRTGKILANAELYRELYAVAEKFQIFSFKIKGHDAISKRVNLPQKIFAMLDKLGRKKLREVVLAQSSLSLQKGD